MLYRQFPAWLFQMNSSLNAERFYGGLRGGWGVAGSHNFGTALVLLSPPWLACCVFRSERTSKLCFLLLLACLCTVPYVLCIVQCLPAAYSMDGICRRSTSTTTNGGIVGIITTSLTPTATGSNKKDAAGLPGASGILQ